MNTRILLKTAAVFVTLTLAVLAADNVFVVKYVSTENVYLNGGSGDGLAVGQRLLLKGRDGCTVELEIVYVAEHSASCVVNTDSCAVGAGDHVTLLSPLAVDTVNTTADTTKPTGAIDTTKLSPVIAKSYARKDLANLSGSVALLLYSWNDRSQANLDFFQSTARLNLRARRLFGSGFTFNVRTRGRFDQRQRAYNSFVGRKEWENRVWEISLAYDDPRAGLNLYFGRVLSRRIPSAGYLDGGILEARLSQNLRFGLLAGLRPEWAYDVNAVSLRKTGGYMTFLFGEEGHTVFEQTIAALGEYHAGNVSRELVLVNGRLSASNKWGFYHALDIDINRSWRKQKTGKSLAFSSVNFGVWYRFTSRIRANIGYDNRTNYWTYDTKATVDSLFDDHMRSGIRGQVDLTLPAKTLLSMSFGSRKRTGDADPTLSYSASVFKTALWRSTARVWLQYSGFDGLHEHGHNYSLRLSDNLSNAVRWALAYGKYSYHADDFLSQRTSSWYEATLDADLSRRTFLSFGAQLNAGDDIDGLRLQSEIGWRF